MGEQPHDLSAFFDAWELFRDPALAGTLAGGLLGLLGVYVVVRRMVFLSAALSQAAGLGVAGAWFAQIHLGISAAVATPTVGATVASLVAAAAMLAGRSNLAARRDGMLGWVYLVGAAGTLAIGTRIVQEVQDIETILFGSAVAVLPEDLTRVVALTVAVGLLHAWLHRGFVQVTLDPDAARVRGLPSRWLGVLLIATLALSVSVCTRVLGALPVFAFTVLPPMAALRLAPNLPRALVVSALLGATAGFAGYLVAFRLQLPVGASQALVAAGLAGVAAALQWGRERWGTDRPEAHGQHRHGPGCGHLPIEHDGHVDYLHDGHLDHVHEAGTDEHALRVSDANPTECTPDHQCAHHPADHVHGPGCGHPAIRHGDHFDHLVGGHLHHPHGDHCDDHGPIDVRHS